MSGGTLFGHPRGLYVLAFTEMWERFSYYGMRALLMFYLTEKLLFSDSESFALYGSYTTLAFAAPVLGGLVADRVLGFRRSVFAGGCFMIAGHAGLAWLEFSGQPPSLQLFYLSLALLIVGVGLLKPNVTTMVGELYPAGSPLKDSAFTIFVCGINVGAMSAALICGYVGHRYGWGYGFGVAALGIALGLLVFWSGQRHLRGIGLPPPGTRTLLVQVAIALAVLAAWQLVQAGSLGYGMLAAFAVATGWSLLQAYRRYDRVDRERLFAALALMAFWILAAAFIEQEGSSMNLFAQRVVDREVAGIEIHSSQLLATPAALLILGSPFFAWWWRRLGTEGRNPATTHKFAWSLLTLAAGFGVLTLGITLTGEGGKVPLFWLLALYALFGVGTLLIIPAGLSAITQLAARGAVGFMMGFWLLSNAVGNFLSAKIAGHSSLEGVAPGAVLGHYETFFGTLALVALALALMLWLVSPLIRRWMNGVN